MRKPKASYWREVARFKAAGGVVERIPRGQGGGKRLGADGWIRAHQRRCHGCNHKWVAKATPLCCPACGKARRGPRPAPC